MKKLIAISILLASSSVQAIPISVDMTGVLGPLYTDNSRFFSSGHDNSGTFKLHVAFDAPSINNPASSSTTQFYNSAGIADSAYLELNGVTMDLNQFTQGLHVQLLLTNNRCPNDLPSCDPSTATDQLMLRFSAADYLNNDPATQLTNGSILGNFAALFSPDTFNGLAGFSSTDGNFSPDNGARFYQNFNYLTDNNRYTELVSGGSGSSLRSISVSVPEPGSLGLLAAGIFGMVVTRKLKKRN